MSFARHIGVKEKDVVKAQMKHPVMTDQALEVLCRLAQNKEKSEVNRRMEKALRRIGRTDIIKRIMYSVEETTEIREEIFRDWKRETHPG